MTCLLWNLPEILKNHALWLKDKTGERADLENANLQGANLQGANLRGANLRCADLENANLRDANLRGANLRDANLRGANLQGANLRGTDLRGADLDYSVFPLWCGGIGWKVDDKLPKMLAAFICSMDCEDVEIKEMQTLLYPYAVKSHRANEILGEIL